MPTISIQPNQLDVGLYAGDGFGMHMNFVVKETGEPWPLEGVWTAHIYYDAGLITEFNIDSTGAAEGKLVLSLTGAQTNAVCFGLWDLQQRVTGSEPRTWYRGNVTTARDVTA